MLEDYKAQILELKEQIENTRRHLWHGKYPSKDKRKRRGNNKNRFLGWF